MDENKKIIKKYNSMPDLEPTSEVIISWIGIGILIFILCIGIIFISLAFVINYFTNDIFDVYALEIYKIRNLDLTCNELKDRSYNEIKYRNEVNNRMYKDKCISWTEWKEIKKDIRCAAFNSVECRITELEKQQNTPSKPLHEKGR
jgi:hypothetical protein